MEALSDGRRIASILALASAAVWGLYWIPVRHVAEVFLPGAWGALSVVLVGTALLSPFALRHQDRIRAASPSAFLPVALGGAAIGLYAVGLVYGQVAIVVLLFYLSPVWSTLIGRLGFGWPTPWLRYASIVVGLTGLLLVLGADGTWPLPRQLGDWLGLGAGALWALASTGIRTRNRLGVAETTFVGALGGSAATLLVLALTGAVWPGLPTAEDWASIGILLIGTAGLWWGVATAGILWAASQLEPARLGVLLMSEVLVGVLSAALLAGERLNALEILGGTLILTTAVLEVWPAHTPQTDPES